MEAHMLSHLGPGIDIFKILPLEFLVVRMVKVNEFL